ncbi:hypothetical protein BCR36DRAFT_332323 [Piromyces finnis]|uniref:Uncharacterized protein n=1 Tax=Piromyces finnis TaxID=1754191 RepID=A0A1Y1V404_9FUNG|nr:hypothetical protein BCR36DRAFT_332323 [Piromyces finnis]|eukprot:ORX45930.1 hypothetical protein BCR36DRAFT_332323 [Piromyces finnis]
MSFISRKKTLVKCLLILILILFTFILTIELPKSENEYNAVIQTHLKNAFIKNETSKEILYISRNQNAVDNMKYIMGKLGYEVYNLIPWYSPKKRPQCFNNGECSTIFTALCRKYEYIIINEIASDGYGYLNSGCSSKIIFELNNRYDVNIPKEETREFSIKFSTSLMNKNKEISVIIQNSYENYYACMNGVHIPSYHIISSTGYVNGITYEEIESVEKEELIAIVEKTNQDSLIAKMELKKRDIPFEMVAWKNCNPKTLAKYKVQLILPSQITSSKIIENFRYGIVMMIPSEAFLREMITESDQYSFDAPDIIYMDEGLENYTTWYNDKLKDLFVFFNSWDDVRGLLHSVNFEKIRIKAKEFAEKQELKVVDQWSEIVGKTTNDKFLIKHKKPICKNDMGFFFNYSD